MPTFDAEPDEAAEIDFLATGGDEAVAELYSRYRPRFLRMVEFRLDRRLYGRVDAGDVLQEAYLEVARRCPEFLSEPTVSFFVWARQITWQTLLLTHRRHLDVKMRDAGQEVSLRWAGAVGGTSGALAAQLVADRTSPSQAAMRHEAMSALRAALDAMDEIDREVLALRHFEHLSNNQVASVLGINKTAASNRYVRAIKRLREILESIPGIQEGLK